MEKIERLSKKIIASILVVAMSFGAVPSVYAEEQYDENNDEQFEDVYDEQYFELPYEDIASTTDNYVVDKTSPYDGEYLIMTNTEISYAYNSESVGVLPSIEFIEETEEETEENIDYDENIVGFDNEGVALIDPSSVLPELIIGDEGIEEDDPEETIEAANYYVGYTKTLYLNTSRNGNYTPKTCVCLSVGNHCTVWVPTDDPIYTYNKTTMTNYTNSLRDEYESMYMNTVNAFGDMYYADYYGDQDGKTAFICYDLEGDGASGAGSYLGGYFYGADLNANYSNKTGNNMDCLHIDSYQGMNRQGYTLTTKNIYGTMMHELQHMIMWSQLAKSAINSGNYYLSLTDNIDTVPVWLNEGYSEAATHLCYGYNSGRISNFNSNVYGGRYPLLVADSSFSLINYSVSYLFCQYIRTQYAQIKGNSGWSIYADALALVNANKNLLTAIAQLLEVTPEELVENFWIATFMRNAEGPYGYNGEAWAENINQKITTSRSTSLYPGASQVISKSSLFTPSGNGRNIKYAGLSKTKKETPLNTIALNVSVINSGYGKKTISIASLDAVNVFFYYTTDGTKPTRDSNRLYAPNASLDITKVGTTNVRILAAADGYKDTYTSADITIEKLSAPVITPSLDDEGNLSFSIVSDDPEADIYYGINGVSPIINGTKYDGSVVRYPYNNFSKISAVARRKGYADSSETQQNRPSYSQVPLNWIVDTREYDGHVIKLAKKNGELLTYTMDGTNPTKSSGIMPEDGLPIRLKGKTTVNITGWKTGYLPKTISYDVDICLLNAPTIQPTLIESTKEYKVTINDNGPSTSSGCLTEIYYSVDGGADTKYVSSFNISATSAHTIKAYAKRLGDITSDKAYKSTYELADVEINGITSTPVYGGYNVTVSVEDGAEVRYTTNGSEPIKASPLFPTEGINVTKTGTTTVTVKAWKSGFLPSVKKENITVGSLNKPTISSTWNSETFEYSISMANSSSNPDATIFYSVDNSALQEYTGEFILAADKAHSISAYSAKLGCSNSEKVTYSTSAAQSITPKTIVKTAVYGGYKLSIDNTDSNVVYRYTLDGTEPITSSELWPKDGITISKLGNTVVKVKAWKNGYYPGSRSTEVTVNKLKSPKVSSTLVDYLNEYKIKIEDKNDTISTELMYSVDNSDTENYLRYNSGFSISAKDAHTVFAYARKKGYADSDVVSINTDKIEMPYSALTSVPRVPVTVITVNKQYADGKGAEMLVMPAENEEVYSCELYGTNSRFFKLENLDDDNWTLLIDDASVATGSYQFDMLMRGTPYKSEPAKTVKITVKVVDKKPTVTLKKITMNKYYSNGSMPVEVTSKDGIVNVVGLKDDKLRGFKDNFVLTDTDSDGSADVISMNGSYESLIKDSANKPVVAGMLAVNVEGYREQNVPITIGINSTMPKISQSVAAPKYNYDLFVNDNYSTVFDYQIVNGNNKIALDDITNISVDTQAKAYDKVSGLLASDNPVSVDEKGRVTVKFNSLANSAATYTVPLLISAQTEQGDLSNIPATAKFTIDAPTTNIKVTLGASTIKLNRNINDSVSTKVTSTYSDSFVSDVICTPFNPDKKANTDNYVGLDFNSETSCLEAYYNDYDAALLSGCTTYKFNCVPIIECLSSGETVASSQPFVVTVSIIDKAPAITATAKGNICVLGRDNTSITYTVKKNNFFNEFDVSNEDSIALCGPISTLGSNEVDGSDKFELSGDYLEQYATTGTVSVKLKNGVDIIRGQKYVISIRFLLKDGKYMYTPNIRISPTQSTVKITQDKKPVLYGAVNMRRRVDTIVLSPSVGEIESVSFNNSKNAKIPAGLKYELSPDNTGKIIVKLTDSSVKPGDYVINLDVIYKGELIEKTYTKKTYPVSVKVSVK